MILLAIPVFGQDQKKKMQSTVINILGANVYEQPTFGSKTLTKLLVGEFITIEKQIPSNERFQIGPGFSIPGNWIKPESIDGYIFSSDLTDKEVDTGLNKFGQHFINLRGKLLSTETEEKQTETPMGNFPKYFEYKYYENGNYTYIEWDGCFDHIYEYKNLSINEVYHQMVSDYSKLINENEISVPSFFEKVDNNMKFEGVGATQDLTFECKENGISVVSSYDCT